MKVNINNQDINNALMDQQKQMKNMGPVAPKATLQQSIAQNNRKVIGASSIRTLIKSAATRDNK